MPANEVGQGADLGGQGDAALAGDAHPGPRAAPGIAFLHLDQARLIQHGEVLGQVAGSQAERVAQLAEFTGHGKSTLLNLLGGLDGPTSGTIEFDGKNLAQLREAQVTMAAGGIDRVHLADLQPGAHAVGGDKLWRECGLTLILVTHDTAIARRAQRVGVMSKGLSIYQDGRQRAANDSMTD